MSRAIGTLLFALLPAAAPSAADAIAPWTQTCAQFTQPYRYSGIYPAAMTSLESMSVKHRIVRGLMAAATPDDVHSADATVDGVEFTGAIDLSVKCLSSDGDIKGFLSALADGGFVAWYRKPGSDGWAGAPGEPPRPHIHAVWVGDRLKNALEFQVNEWLAGRNGLDDRAPYSFWQPTDAQKDAIRARFNAAHGDEEEAFGRSVLARL